MTKLDGDQRGGAVLSVKAITGVPIKFLGTGEHIQDLEPFRPEGMADRILGGGDIVELARRAQDTMDQEELRRQQEAMEKGQFTLLEFRNMLAQAGKMGPIGKLMSLMPGMGQLREMQAAMKANADQDLKRIGGIIDSMTADERRNPKKVIDQSRRRRIAAGAGVEPHEVNELVKQFEPMKEMMERMAGMGIRERMKYAREIQKKAMSDPSGQLQREKKGTGKRLSNSEKKQLKKEREKEARRRKRLERSKKDGG
jgi:signal recognition particle subunit SRP54